jgi:hypothetical protein
LLIDLLFGRGHKNEVRRVATTDAAFFSLEEQQAIEAALRAHSDV